MDGHPGGFPDGLHVVHGVGAGEHRAQAGDVEFVFGLVAGPRIGGDRAEFFLRPPLEVALRHLVEGHDARLRPHLDGHIREHEALRYREARDQIARELDRFIGTAPGGHFADDVEDGVFGVDPLPELSPQPDFHALGDPEPYAAHRPEVGDLGEAEGKGDGVHHAVGRVVGVPAHDELSGEGVAVFHEDLVTDALAHVVEMPEFFLFGVKPEVPVHVGRLRRVGGGPVVHRHDDFALIERLIGAHLAHLDEGGLAEGALDDVGNGVDDLARNRFFQACRTRQNFFGYAAMARKGSYIAPGVVLMPCYVNIGAYVGSGTMVDTWATVGSCAQIGKNVHLSGGVGIGGVLEPLQASPTIIEDNCFIGARSEVVEGVMVEQGSVISMGVYIGQSTRIYDREKDEILYGRVPAGSVVVSGNLPGGDGKYSLYCAVIVKKVDEKTRSKVGINELLRAIDD